MGIGRILLFLGVCFGLWMALRWFVRTPPEQVSKILIKVAIGAAILFLVVLAATGRLHPLFAAAGAAVGGLLTVAVRLIRMPWALGLAQRLFYHYRARKNSAEPAANQRSQVETHFVRMFLDHDSGEMGGEIITGRLAGFRLSQLDQSQLAALWQEYVAVDSESAALLEAYLDHAHGEGWRDQCGAKASHESSSAPPSSGRMSLEEACKILGVEEGADREAIIAAHRRLAQKVHPDRGGSNYLAAQINRAKEALLKG
ncbi:MAG: DnaJ domain-containing protein [Candidatus Polarisedimenticolaceae bacterium]|nr:DnaJ domain-containing protein [Candidatus Polarisedimenticolaceae bacterium]